jgi:hypothetical protein
MMRRTIIFVLVISLLALLTPSLVQAQSRITVLSSSAQADFPASLTFNLSAESDTTITDVRLRYIVEQEAYAEVIGEAPVTFNSATKISVNWVWDMRQTGGLPPGATVHYWWIVKDTDGEKVETSRKSVQFDDERYGWQSITQDMVTIYWYEGQKSFADELMASAQQALAKLAQDTGARLESSVKIYVYASTADLQGALIFPQEWTGGVAFTGQSTIAIGIPTNNLAWGKRAIAHELAHQATHQMTRNPYNDIPTWLSEGLAMYAEGPLEAYFASSLKNAINQNSLISVRSLASPFSAFPGMANLSYAESYSIIEFLVDSYGQGKMSELLSTFKAGSTYDGALLKVYVFDMDGLDTLERDYLAQLYQPESVTEVPVKATMPVWPIALLAALATALLLVVSLIAESWTWRRHW